MSLAAQTWALYKAPVEEPTALLVLWALADRAHEDGRYAWPSQAWIADKARCSVRTVRRYLAQLETDGIIRRGDQQVVAHFRADHRPVVWDLDLTLEREPQDSLSAGSAEPQDTGGQSRRTPVSDKTSLLPSGEPVLLAPPAPKQRKAEATENRIDVALNSEGVFVITEAMAKWGAKEVPNIADAQRETRQFVDYWTARGGKDARKADWTAAWRTWMRNAQERATRFAPRPPQGQAPRRPGAVQR